MYIDWNSIRADDKFWIHTLISIRDLAQDDDVIFVPDVKEEIPIAVDDSDSDEIGTQSGNQVAGAQNRYITVQNVMVPANVKLRGFNILLTRCDFENDFNLNDSQHAKATAK